jgi:hypothetical protein
MKINKRQSGVTFMEMTVVIAVVALLVGISIPAVRALRGSFESEGGTKVMINAALSAARAIAAKEHNYAGVRFQTKYEQGNKASQYMVFIIHDFDNTGLKWGFRAVEGMEPIKLPDSIGVMDLRVRTDHRDNQWGAEESDDEAITMDYLDDTIAENIQISGTNRNIQDSSTFSIVFSPSGKIVIHDVRVRNRDGIYRPNPLTKITKDDVFNGSEVVISHKNALLIQDDYANLGLGQEPSRRSFVIYDKNRFSQLLTAQQRYDYLMSLDVVYLNPHTGHMIKN